MSDDKWLEEGDMKKEEEEYMLAEEDREIPAGEEAAEEDPEIEAIKQRVKEMEEEAAKLKEMQKEAEDSLLSPSHGGVNSTSTADKGDIDSRSVYVGNVDYSATATELEQHFHGCGSVNRVTILCDKFTGQPKGFAFVEFAEKECVDTAVALSDSLFKGRQIKVSAKRTNIPGISTTNRGFRGRGRGRARGFHSPRRGRGAYRSRRASFYSPY